MSKSDWDTLTIFLWMVANVFAMVTVMKHLAWWSITYCLLAVLGMWIALMIEHKAHERTRIPRVMLGVLFIVGMVIVAFRA